MLGEYPRLPIAVMASNSKLIQSKWTVRGRLICWSCCLDECCRGRGVIRQQGLRHPPAAWGGETWFFFFPQDVSKGSASCFWDDRYTRPLGDGVKEGNQAIWGKLVGIYWRIWLLGRGSMRFDIVWCSEMVCLWHYFHNYFMFGALLCVSGEKWIPSASKSSFWI